MRLATYWKIKNYWWGALSLHLKIQDFKHKYKTSENNQFLIVKFITLNSWLVSFEVWICIQYFFDAVGNEPQGISTC